MRLLCRQLIRSISSLHSTSRVASPSSLLSAQPNVLRSHPQSRSYLPGPPLHLSYPLNIHSQNPRSIPSAYLSRCAMTTTTFFVARRRIPGVYQPFKIWIIEIVTHRPLGDTLAAGTRTQTLALENDLGCVGPRLKISQ